MSKLSGVLFGFQIVGDGTSTAFTADLTSSAASLAPFPPGFSSPQFTPNFNVNSATGVTGVAVSGSFSISSAAIASGRVTVVLNTAPAIGQLVTITGTLVF